MNIPKCLTIAGSDSGGGAGIQADIKTFTALKVYGMTAITSLTAQNTQGVFEVIDVPGSFVYKQIEVVCKDIGVDAAKTGMLSNAEIIQNVAKAVKDFGIEKLVVDPVMFSKSGYPLLKEESISALIEELMPLCLVITPNKYEAEKISQVEIKSEKDMVECAKKIHSLGAKCVVVKGGHIKDESDTVTDIIYTGDTVEKITYPRAKTKNTHGTGCTFSAAICSYLAKGYNIIESIKKARAFLQMTIENSLDIGRGFGPVNQLI